MDAIILAGGRGRRMGALTTSRNKGTLSYKGKPLVVHVTERVLTLETIDTIYVATGYRGDTISEALRTRFEDRIASGKIQITEIPHVFGDLKRLAAIIQMCNISGKCFVCGIDVLVNTNVTRQLLEKAEDLDDAGMLVLGSADTSVAPSHSRLHIVHGIVTGYVRPNEGHVQDGPDWYAGLGAYVYGAQIVKDLRADPPESADGIIHVARYVWRRGSLVRGITTKEPWLHFEHGGDFRKPML